MRKQCIVAILAILFSVMMASTAVPLGLPDLPEEVPELPDEVPELPEEVPELPEEVPELPDVVQEEGAELLDVVLEEVSDPSPGIGERATKYRYDDIPKRTYSAIVSDITNQRIALTDDMLRIGEDGSVATDITEDMVYRWVIGNESIELIEDGNRTISPEDLKELIGEKGIVLVYTWQIGEEGIELVGENGTVPPGDLQEFMENHSFYLIGTTPINSTTEESEEPDSTMKEKGGTDSTMEDKAKPPTQKEIP